MGSKEKGEGGLGFYSSSSRSVEESIDVAREWRNAQSIPLTVTPDMVTAAKRELQFLAEINSVTALLREGPTLDCAIQRYEHCWLPLLASEGSKDGVASPLVPPLDCAWVWHCHRLNPIQYAEDCERLYGRLLGVHHIEQDTGLVEITTEKTKELWMKHYPEEEYCLQLTPTGASEFEIRERRIEYDLVGAVTRQNSFYYQVSQPYVKEDSYLHSAEERYKGFLHLFAHCGGNGGTFLVPTYDIDLMWHTHQLDPEAYNRDLLVLSGRLLAHDDTDENRAEGAKLRTGFQDTKRLWEETFGMQYEKAGAMYRGPAPSPVPASPGLPHSATFGATFSKLQEAQRHYLVARESVQLCVNVLEVRNLHPHKRGTKVFVSVKGFQNAGDFHVATSEADMLTSARWHQSPWMMHCATSMEGVVFELRAHPTTGIFKSLTGSKLLGEVRIPFSTLLASPTLAIQGWHAVCQKSGVDHVFDTNHKPPVVLLAASITSPTSSPYLLRAVNGKVQSDIFDSVNKKSQKGWHAGRWLTRIVLDQNSEEVYLVRVRKMKGRMRDLIPVEEHEKQVQVFQRDLYKLKAKPWSLKSVEFAAAAQQIMNTQAQKDNANVQREWCLLDKDTTVTVRKIPDDPHWEDHPELELHGDVGYPVKLLSGRWLQYQVHGAKPEDESGFVTLIRYTPDCPTGKATALFNWKAAVMEVSAEENVILVILLSTIIATTVNDLQGATNKTILKATKRRQFPGHAQWGAVIMGKQLGGNVNMASTMIYHDWWLDPKSWAQEIYATEGGGYQGGSGCGGGGCGGAACAGGCTGDNGGGPFRNRLSFAADQVNAMTLSSDSPTSAVGTMAMVVGFLI